MHAVSLIAIAAGVGLLLLAALHDVAARTVPNPLAAAIAVAGVVVQALQGGLVTAVPAALLVFVCAALCWRRGWMGGGDVKLLAAASLLVPAGLIPALIMATALAGGLLAIPYLLARRRLPRAAARPPDRPPNLVVRALRAERWRLRRGGPMPYAVAIACGALFALSHGGLP